MCESTNRYGEKPLDDQDGLFYISTSGQRMPIKQELPPEESSGRKSSIPKHEDSSSSDKKVKIKEEAPSKLATLKKSLELNTKIRDTLESEIQKVKAACERNLEKQAILSKVLEDDKRAKSTDRFPTHVRAISVFAAPYFRDVKRMVPPLNEDAKIKRQNQDVNAYLKPPRPWCQSENKKLLDGVTGFALMSALKPHKIKRDYLRKKLKEQDLIEFEVEVLEKQIASLEKKIKIVSEKPLNQLLDEVKGKIDWMTISAVNMEGQKTPEECENMWNNFLDFSINKEVFTLYEDEKLKNLAEDYKERDWDTIAKRLKTNRTPIQCFERYQTRLSTNLRKRYWTQEEDERLINLIGQLRHGKIIPWNKISLLMEGRTRQQCINRFERSISQVYNRGPWTAEEDAILIACYQKYGIHWAKMKDYFQRRSTYSIRERYVNALDPQIRMGGWSKDEDRLLIDLIRRYGYGKWSRICKHIPGRTDNMCLVRAGRLLEHSVRFHSDRGTEYDPGVHDPETFAKILKPLAPTKFCAIRNLRLKECRGKALELLLDALRKVLPDIHIEIADLESGRPSWLSSEVLHRISVELHEILNKNINKGGKPFVPHIRYIKKRLPIRKRMESSDEEIFQVSPEKVFPNEKRLWLDSVMSSMFQMVGKVIPPVNKRTAQVFNTREMVEISLYKAYLYNQFHCLAKCDSDDDLQNVVFSGIDFSETLQTVVSYFIQPPIYEGQFIVLSPNMTTIGGMEVIEATEKRLQTMSNYVSHSKNYLDYVYNRRNNCPKCLQCLHRDQQVAKFNPSDVTSDMEKNFFFVDERMDIAAHVESSSVERINAVCSCACLQDSRKSVELLRQRFLALFLWPVLLATTDINKEQEDFLCMETSKKTDNYFWRMHHRGTGGNTRKKRVKRTSTKVKTDEDSLPMLEDQNEIPKPSTSGSLDAGQICPNESTAPEGSNTEKKRRKRKIHSPPEELRRSKRACVLNRTSFAFAEVNDELPCPAADNDT